MVEDGLDVVDGPLPGHVGWLCCQERILTKVKRRKEKGKEWGSNNVKF